MKKVILNRPAQWIQTAGLVLLLSAGAVMPVWAGGWISIAPDTGVPSAWDPPVKLHPETVGVCGSFSNAEMVAKLEENISHWEDIDGIALTFQVIEDAVIGDINVDNYNDYFVDSAGDPGLDDEINPVIFDDDGEIVAEIFLGVQNKYSVLGFAGPDGFTSDYETIVDGQAFFNCRCQAGNAAGACPPSSNPIVFSEEDLDFSLVWTTLKSIRMWLKIRIFVIRM
jgi:hypothetical protein